MLEEVAERWTAACMVRRKKVQAEEARLVFVSAKAKRALKKREAEKARKKVVRAQKRTRLAIELELGEDDQVGSASSDVSSSSSSKSPGTMLRAQALVKAKDAQRLFNLAGAISAIDRLDTQQVQDQERHLQRYLEQGGEAGASSSSGRPRHQAPGQELQQSGEASASSSVQIAVAVKTDPTAHHGQQLLRLGSLMARLPKEEM